MITYTGIKRGTPVAVNTTPVKLFSTNARGRSGYRLYNPSDANDLLIIEVMAGATAPVAGDFTAEDLDFRIGPNKTQESGAEDNVDVYGVMSAAGSTNIAVRELFSRRDNRG